jgi:AcrR family transcriptional regulator
VLLVQVTLEDRGSDRAVARRSQIVEATIVTIAELGYQRATFVEIARRASLSSTRLISYHFQSRDDLMAHVATEVVNGLGSAVHAQVSRARSPAGMVHAYIKANVAYMGAHRTEMAALTALLFAGALQISPEQSSAGVDALAAIIAEGRRVGQFRRVDPLVAATVVQRAIEGVPLHLRDHPGADLAAHASELIRFFDAALLARVTDPSAR